VFVIPGRFVAEPAGRPELVELVAAVGTTRVVEPRITGGFAYGPVKAPVRSGESVLDSSTPDVRIAVARLEQRAQNSRRPQDVAAVGVAYLAVANADKAVAALEESTDLPTPDPSRLSDLAAAYLVRGTERKQSQDVAKALAAADRAVRSNPALPEAAFNRALALERLFLTPQARQAWEEYLKLDDSSQWADEARRRVESLGRSLRAETEQVDRQLVDRVARSTDDRQLGDVVRQFPQTAREWAENELWIAWPASYLAGQEAAAEESVQRSRRIADIIAASFGDRLLLDTVRTIERSRSAQERQSLARGHQLFGQGMAKYEEDDLADSMRLFSAARNLLEERRSPLALWTRLQFAIDSYYRSDIKGSTDQLAPLIPAAEKADYVRLVGLLYRMHGLLYGVQLRLPEQVTDYQSALSSFIRAGDLENVAAIHASLAETMDYQGEPQLAWMHRTQALAGLNHVRRLRRRQTILFGSVASCLRQGLPHTALFFQEAVLDVARQWDKPRPLAEGYLKRADVRQQLGWSQLAVQDLVEAERWLEKLEPGSFAMGVKARIQLATGEVQRHDRPGLAVQALTAALEYFSKAGMNWASARAYLARGRAHFATGRADLAEADFSGGIRAFEEQRAKFGEESLRIAYYEQPWDLFSQMIELKAIRQKQPAAALKFAEQARSRTLLEAVLRSRSTAPVDPERVHHQLPQSVAVLYYSVLEDGILAWVIRHDGIDFFHRPIRESELTRLVAHSRSAGAFSRDAETLKRLYDELIRPARSYLRGRRTLVIVPDGALHVLPFAGLIDRESGRYLVEDYPLAISPSLTLSLQLAHAGALRPASSALVVGNPRAGEADVNLPELSGAEQEARQVSKIYAQSDLLVGAEATKSRFLEQLGQHDVVHFAGHAISNTTFPGLSRLLLASPDGVASGSLFVHELGNRRLHRTQVVVLAGCRTSSGQIRRGEGVISLARPFLAAGVPVVVGALSDLDDEQSRHLFVAFHRALIRGVAPFDALREAQLDAIRNQSVTFSSTWANIVAIGGLSGLGDFEVRP
jgi:CHAT domain-containing protein